MIFELLRINYGNQRTIKLNKWAQDMAEQQASGLSQKKWCEMKGIGTTTYECRCRQVRSVMEERIHESTALVWDGDGFMPTIFFCLQDTNLLDATFFNCISKKQLKKVAFIKCNEKELHLLKK